jgi:acyl-coenzyme A synthetase/AMP-(fatty) acid ligase
VVDDDLAALGRVEEILTGGDVTSADHVRRALAARSGRRVVHCYGPTETTTFATAHVFDDPAVVPDPLPLGHPVRGAAVRVLTEGGTPAAWTEPGELWIGGAGVGLGYLGDPALTRACFGPLPGEGEGWWFRSGDRVRALPDGGLEFLGRFDDQVKVRGRRVGLGEVELALVRHPAVRRAGVVAVSVPHQEKHLAAFVVGNEVTCDAQELRRQLAQSLPAHMVPATIRWLATLPVRPNGKLDRTALERAALETGCDDAEPGATLPVPELVGRIWAQVLGRDAVPDAVAFLDLGGDSLTAIAVASRILGELGVEVDLWSILDADGYGALAAEVMTANGGDEAGHATEDDGRIAR